MQFEFSLAHLALQGASPIEMISIAARTGYNFVSFRLTPVTSQEKVYPFLSDSSKLKDICHALEDHDMQVLDVELIRLEADKSPFEFEKFLDVAATLGARHVLCQTPDLDLYRVAEKFAQICEMARQYNLTIDLEFPSWTENGNFAQSAWILGQADQENGGMLIDTLHFSRSISRIEALQTVPKNWFNFVQLCDARSANIGPIEDMIHIARSERLSPGDGVIPIADILRALPVVPYSLEIPNDRLRAELGDEAYARKILQDSKHYLTRHVLGDQPEQKERQIHG